MKKAAATAFLLLMLLVVNVQASDSGGRACVKSLGEIYATTERVNFVLVLAAFGCLAGVIAFALVISRKPEE